VIKAARRAGVILMVGHIERFNPTYGELKHVLESLSPLVVTFRRLSSYVGSNTDVDVVLDLMIHDLDLVLSFNPGPVEEVRAAGVPVLSPNIDIANARIAFASGCVANLTASRVSTNKMRRLRFFQRDRYVSIDFQTRQAMLSRRVEGSGPRPTIDVETFQAGDEEPLRLELESFVRAVADGSRPVVSGEDGEAALTLAARVLDAIGQFTQRHSIDEANAAAFGHNPV